MNRVRPIVAAVAAGLALGAFAEVGVGENILLNPGFESVGEPNPQYWNNEGKDKDTVIPANGMEPGALPAVKFVGRVGSKGVNLRQYGLRLQAGGRYRLSAKVRAVDFVTNGDNGFKIANDRWRWAAGFGFPKGTYDWRLLERDFTANAAEMDVVFTVADAQPGEELALNCVSVHPYLPRETAS